MSKHENLVQGLPNLLAFNGRSRAGKDSIAEFLPHKPVAIARPLKDAAKILFNFSEEQLYDTNLKNVKDDRWGITPRESLVWLGDVLAEKFGRDHLCKVLASKLVGEDTVITDVRMPEDRAFAKEIGAELWYIDADKRLGPLPEDAHATERLACTPEARGECDIIFDNNGEHAEIPRKLEQLKEQYKNHQGRYLPIYSVKINKV